MHWKYLPLVLLVSVVAPSIGLSAAPVDFAREVLPILRRSCWECHGPDKQEANLRLDLRDAAVSGGDSGPAWKPGEAEASELLRRIRLPKSDPEVMPSRGEPLTAREIQTVERWIAEGAHWPEQLAATDHWAYVPPRRPSLPAVRDLQWPRTAVDFFILARLEAEQLSPSPPADRATLLRRVHLDLIGLPPDPDDVMAFLTSEDSAAYEKVVDRLLGSDQFAVRWGRPWLDYARYADSHGFQRDDLREVWAYRDWVLAALNADMSFEQFSIEQLAGDLIPNATDDQRIATGFNRNAPTNVEAGSDPEETRVNQVHDRVNTLGMVWMGTTLECAQCHDHKYDPISMQDYYGLFACFNQTELEADRSNPKVPGSIRFLGPEVELGDPRIVAERQQFQTDLATLEREIAAMRKGAAQPDRSWEESLRTSAAEASREEVLPVIEFDSLGGATHEVLEDGSVLLSGEAPDRDTYTVVTRSKLSKIRAIKLETLTHSSLPGEGPGRGDAARPNFVLQDFQLLAGPVEGADSPQPVKFSEAAASFAQARFPARGAIDDDLKSAWAINPRFHEPHWATFELAEPLGHDGGTRLTFRLVQNFGGSRTIGRLRLSAVTGSNTAETLPGDVVAALDTDPKDRTALHKSALLALRLKQSPEYQQLLTRKKEIETKLRGLKAPTSLVMREVSVPRPSHLLLRGDFRTPGEPIEPRLPTLFQAASTPIQNRLDLARSLFADDHPLVARVAVNRWWGELFGHGLVMTPEDFGIKGDSPTHPELLDWLAVEYREGGWSLKALLRQIVLSATYRQSSRVSPELLALDDQNRLYARGPRVRLDAESIRDQALASAGLLSRRLGGPPIRPYQPDGLWVKVGGERYDYVVSPGDEAYRRGLFVVLKRGAPYPSFMNFDATNRMACRVRRTRSNTPLQALTLLNDPVYVEAAKALAVRILEDRPDHSDAERLAYGHQLVLARPPRDAEFEVLMQLLTAQRQASEGAPVAKEFLEAVRSSIQASPAEFAAWYAVATALLNLDEAVTKP